MFGCSLYYSSCFGVRVLRQQNKKNKASCCKFFFGQLILRQKILRVLVPTFFFCSVKVFSDELAFHRQATYFDIPSLPLSSAILEFALQANIEILSPFLLVADQKSAPLIGPLQKNVALRLLISNTSLSFKQIEKDSWVIFEKSESQDPVSLSESAGKDLFEEEVLVTSSRYPFRYTTLTSSSDRSNSLSIYNGARFLNVVPRQFIVDQQPSDLVDVLKHTSGITPGDGLADSNDDFFIRGFARDAIYIDGIRIDSNTGIKIAPSLIDKVETIKGPSTLFYGQAEPGGTVNIVRQSPRNDAMKSIRGMVGGFNQLEFDIDLTGPLNISEDTYYRTTYIRETLDQERDVYDIDRQWFSTILTKSFSDKTKVDMRVERNDSSSLRQQGLIVLVPDNEEIKLIALDREKPTGQKREDFKAQQTLFDVSLIHSLDSGRTVQVKYAQIHESRKGIRAQNNVVTLTGLLANGDDLAAETEIRQLTGVSLDGTTTTISVPVSVGTEVVTGDDMSSFAQLLSVYDEAGKSETEYARIESGGTNILFGLPHHFDFGFEYYGEELYENFILERRNDIQSLLFDDLGGVISSVDIDDTLGELIDRKQSFVFHEFGVFFQDSIDLSDQWLASIGGRYTITNGRRFDLVENTHNDFKTYREFSSQLGLVYQPVDYVSFYSNYSESMKANYQLDDIGTVIPEPELSKQIELGSKLFLSDKLIASAAFFEIEKDNIVHVDFVQGFRQSVLGGKQVVKGFDLDFSYRLSSNTDVIGSTSWLDATIESGQYAGNTPELVARRSSSVFVNHRFSNGRLSGWALNIGGQFVGDRFGNDENIIRINGYGVFDVGISYSSNKPRSNYTFRLDVKNISDETYFTAVEEGIRFNQGTSRTITSSISFEF